MSSLTPAKTIVTCVHKKKPLSNLLELLVSADATAISKKIIFFYFLQGVKKRYNSITKAETEKNVSKSFKFRTFFFIYATVLMLC